MASLGARPVNPFLTHVMRELHARRAPLAEDYLYEQRALQLPFGAGVWLWFVTGGCSWDACTMCDYGKGPAVAVETMVAAVRRGLAEIGERADVLIVTPTGSMLDPVEVPPAARREILALMAAAARPRMFIVESRADSVNDAVLAELRQALAPRAVVVQMGLETANRWVNRFCVNKGSDRQRLLEALDACRAAGVLPAANVNLGTAFLAPAEALADALAAAEWLAAHAPEQILLFPLHAKRHTVLGELYRLGLWAPPSLWSLVELLRRLSPAARERANLSWYRLESPAPCLASPTTCPRCRDAVLALLDAYRAAPSAPALAALTRYSCDCKEAWRRSLAWPATPLPARVAAAYEQLARRLRLEPVWRRHRDELGAALERDWEPIPSLAV